MQCIWTQVWLKVWLIVVEFLRASGTFLINQCYYCWVLYSKGSFCNCLRKILNAYLCIYCIGQGAGFAVSGRIESGFLQQGDNVLVLPSNEYALVKGVYRWFMFVHYKEMQHFLAILINEDVVLWAVAGDHITITLQGMDIAKIK